MKTVKVKISELRSPEKNVRKHNEKQIKEFCRSLKMFGQIRPVVIDEENVVYCGNGLLEAARSLGWEEIEVLKMQGLNENQKKKLMIADNRIYSLGFDDYDSINSIIEEMGDFDIPGFDTETLSNMFGNLENELESFGKLSDDEKAVATRANENRTDAGIRTFADEQSNRPDVEAPRHDETKGPAPVSTVHDEGSQDAAPKRFIKCPHCGGEICC